MAFALHLHFPFSVSRRTCARLSGDVYDPALEKRFYEALRVETELVAEQYGIIDSDISTLYVGGGTPSLTSLESFGGWLRRLRSLFRMPEGAEFSFEIDPGRVTVGLLTELRELGVNRPLFDLQSFDPLLLRMLGYEHQPADGHRAVYLANALGFDNFGVDFLYGLPNQTSRMLSADLDHLLDLEPPHISFRRLTVDEGAPLHARLQSGAVRIPDDDVTMSLYRGAAARLADGGYVRYELSSFARPGHECKHCLSYWEGHDYLALGPSGRSFMVGQRFANTCHLDEYINSLTDGRRPLVVEESAPEQRVTEAIFLGFRTARGIDRRQFARRFGQPLEERLDRGQYDVFVRSGHLIPDRGCLRLSEEGILLADEITRRLVK